MNIFMINLTIIHSCTAQNHNLFLLHLLFFLNRHIIHTQQRIIINFSHHNRLQNMNLIYEITNTAGNLYSGVCFTYCWCWLKLHYFYYSHLASIIYSPGLFLLLDKHNVQGTRNYHILRICYSLSTTTTTTQEEEEKNILKGLKKDLRDGRKKKLLNIFIRFESVPFNRLNIFFFIHWN